MIAPEWPRVLHKLAYCSSRDPLNTHGYWAEYLYAIRTSDMIVLLCVQIPRGMFRVPFLPHPNPFSNGNLYPAALLRMRGNYFRPYLSIFACAIEVQHNNENSSAFTFTHTCLLSFQVPLNDMFGYSTDLRSQTQVWSDPRCPNWNEASGLPQVRKWSNQGIGKLTFWRRVRGNLESFNTTDLIPLEDGKISWGYCGPNGGFLNQWRSLNE